jgi:hypothetical protein
MTDRKFAILLAVLVLTITMATALPAAQTASPDEEQYVRSCRYLKESKNILYARRILFNAPQYARGADAQKLEALEVELNGFAAQEADFISQAVALEKECFALAGIYASLKPESEKIEAELKAAREKRKPIFQEVIALRKERDAMTAESKRMHSQHSDVGASREQVNRFNQWVDDWNRRNDDLNARVTDWLNRVSPVSERIKALEAEKEELYASVNARLKEYRSREKAYLDARIAWEGQIREVSKKIFAVARSAWDRETARQAEVNQQARQEAVGKLRAQVKGIQEALRRLDKSAQLDARERKQWENETEQAFQNAWNRGQSMLIDETIGVIGKGLDLQLKDANKEIQKAVEKLAGETDPARRKRLHAAIKLLGKQRDEVQRAQQTVYQRLKEAKQISDTDDWAQSKSGDMEKSLRGVYDIVKMTLGDQGVQKALKIGGKYAAGAGYAQSIADSAYDVTAEVVSWKRINQLNRNSEEYLKAVGRLKNKMEEVVEKIKALESGK